MTSPARYVALALAACLAAAPPALAEPAQRISEAGRRATSPEIAVGPDGAINVVWIDKGLAADRPAPKPHKPGEHSHRSSTDLYFSRSEDGGSTWSRPVRVNREPGTVWGFAVSKPRIAVGPSGTIHVFFPSNDRSAKTGLDIVTSRYTRSTDGGRSFAPARVINGPSEADRRELLGEGLAATYSFGTMGVAPDGTVFALWQDIESMRDPADGANAHMAVSRDDGASFTTEQVAVGGNVVCPCCQLTVAFQDDGELLVGYRRLYADGRDSTVARSSDGGASFAESRVDFARWQIDGCPLKPTELAVDGERVYAAAYNGGAEPPGLYFSRSDDGGRAFAGARQVHPGAPYSDAPELVVPRPGALNLVWQAKVGGPRRLFTSWSADGGKSFSPPAEVPAPAGSAAYPATAAGTDGSVYVAWQHDNEEVFVTRLGAPERAAAAR